uniref:glucuronosyltransferase n=1 Tax=Steinernema glaseri TaxID=37863 RepID=A0A1I7Y9X8_9BILA
MAKKLIHFDVYDVRWPMVEAVAKYKAPPRFRSNISTRATGYFEKTKQMVDDSSGWESKGSQLLNFFEMMSSAMSIVFMPCDFKEPIGVEVHRPLNISLIDPFSSPCAVARVRALRSRYAFVTAIPEPMTVALFSGGILPLSYSPSVFLAKLPEHMNFIDRTLNVFSHKFFDLLLRSPVYIAGILFGPDDVFAPIEPTLMFTNTHPIIHPPMPRTFARIDFGTRMNVVGDTGLPPLDDDLRSFVEDNSFKKIIVFSMSTFTNNGEMPAQVIEVFAQAFQRFSDIGFVWRIKELEERYCKRNIKVVPWIEQRALFEHWKTSGAISHCGQNSYLEAVQAGVPLICIPMQGDQFLQSEIVKEHGIGLAHLKSSLSVEDVIASIDRLLNDAEIQRRSIKLKDMLTTDDAFRKHGNAQWWLHFFLRHTDEQIRRYAIPRQPDSELTHILFTVIASLILVVTLSY